MDKIIPLEKIGFGVENETNRPTGIEGRIGAYHRGVACRQSPSFNRKKWKAERDNSIRVSQSGFTQCEYVSPILRGEKGLQNVKKMFEWISESGHRVNNSCGLHMTFGVQDICGTEDPKEIAPFLATLGKYAINMQDGLYAQTGARRDCHGYASRFNSSLEYSCSTTREIKKLLSLEAPTASDIQSLGWRCERHKAINFNKVGYGTTSSSVFEFRWGAGTTNYRKVLLHLASCMFLIRLAWKNRHHSNDRVGLRRDKRIHRDATTSGVKTFKDLLTKWKMSKCGHGLLDESETLREHWNEMVDLGFRMATKYDERFSAMTTSGRDSARYNQVGLSTAQQLQIT